MTRIAIAFAASAAAIVFCAIEADAAQRLAPGIPASAVLLQRYDADHDGVITRQEMEDGLKAEYAAADKNGDGCLDFKEVTAENALRLKRDGNQASPLVDWNLDGCVDMKEFSNTIHSYFELADRTKDGRISQAELRGPSMPMAPAMTAAAARNLSQAGQGGAGPGQAGAQQSTTATPGNRARY